MHFGTHQDIELLGLAADQAALVDLRNQRVIDDNVMQDVQRDLDLEAARLDLDR